MSKHLTRDRLRELLDYGPLTGLFVWKVDLCNGVCAGDVAGNINKLGYICIMIDGKTHKAHRLAWLWMTGNWPKSFAVDHKNRCPSDNRWDNLREASPSQNACNSRTRSDNSTGYRGVFFAQDRAKFITYINCNGIRFHLGQFVAIEEAIAMRDGAARLLFGEFHHEN